MVFKFIKKLVGGKNAAGQNDDSGQYPLDTPSAFPAFDPKNVAAAQRREPETTQVGNQEEIIAEWLNQLPEHVRPYRLTDHYARLAVKMAELWDQPIPLQNFLRSLVLDDRGGRQGFPEEIAGELFRLTSYVEEKIGPTMPAGFGRADDRETR